MSFQKLKKKVFIQDWIIKNDTKQCLWKQVNTIEKYNFMEKENDLSLNGPNTQCQSRWIEFL